MTITWLTLEELAERWKEPDIGALKRIVKSRNVPHFEIGRRDTDLRINWKRVRFRLDQIEAYEREHIREFTDDDDVEATSKAVVARAAEKEWYE